MNKQQYKSTSTPMTNEQRLGQLQTYLSYFTTVDDYSQLKGEQKSQFDTILEFAKAVATHLKLNIQGSSNGTIAYLCNDVKWNDWNKEEVYADFTPARVLQMFLSSLQEELDKEIKILIDNDGVEKVLTEKIAYTSIEEMLAKFPVQLEEDDRKKMQGIDGIGQRAVMLAKDNFITNQLKKSKYNVYIENNVKSQINAQINALDNEGRVRRGMLTIPEREINLKTG